jgi:Cu-Zn family superoxide dismutase
MPIPGSSDACSIDHFIFATTDLAFEMKSLFTSLITLMALTALVRAQDASRAIAKLESKSGSQVTGLVAFAKEGDEVHVIVHLQNLTPGKHGVHIHEKGDCSAEDGSSAGGHFNPMHQHHGGPDSAERHVGDLGNIEADASGNATLNWKGKMSLSGPDSVIGKSVVVHEKEDDLKSDPAGNAGARVACGVIEAK